MMPSSWLPGRPLSGDFAYPHDQLRRAWELLCLNQFHDIIPGSSIQQVYVHSLRDYEEIQRIGEQSPRGCLDRAG